MSSAEGNKDIPAKAVSMDQSSASGAKRKRGRPRKYEQPSYELLQRAQPIQSIPPLQSARQVLSAQHAQGKDDIIGKHFAGKVTSKFPGFCLVTVKVKDNEVLKGWVPDQNNLNPVTPKNDLIPELPMIRSSRVITPKDGPIPELPMLRPSRVQKHASVIPMKAAPLAPINIEDVTLAKPLQMRRPADKTTDRHVTPLAAKPYMVSGAAAEVPLSVSPSNVGMGTLAEQDTGGIISQSPLAAVPITSVRPVFVPGKQLANNQNELVGEKSFNELQKDSESSNGAVDSSAEAEKINAALVDVVVKDSSGKNQHAHIAINDEINKALGTGGQPNSVNISQHISKEPSDIAEKSDLLRTENVVLKGVDNSKSVAPDGIQSTGDESEMNVDDK